MIEQGFSIATSNGGTSQATIQIPSSLSVDGQHITIDGQQITVEQVIPGLSCLILFFSARCLLCFYLSWALSFTPVCSSIAHMISTQFNLSSP